MIENLLLIINPTMVYPLLFGALWGLSMSYYHKFKIVFIGMIIAMILFVYPFLAYSNSSPIGSSMAFSTIFMAIYLLLGMLLGAFIYKIFFIKNWNRHRSHHHRHGHHRHH